MRTPDGLLYLDRTRNAYDHTCRRRRFLAFEWHRRGISPRKRALPLEIGAIQHDAYASFLLEQPIDTTVEGAVARFTAGVAGGDIDLKVAEKEQAVLLEGMLRGWARLVLPRILAEYEVVRVEGEVQYDFLGCRLGAKPDVLLRRRSDGTLWYVEWKTTSTLSMEYFASWTKAVQLHAGALGVSRTLGEDIAGAIVFCLYKGFYSKQKRRQESIFCYGYGPRDNGGLAYPQQLGYVYKAGQIKYPVVDVKRWVDEMPIEVLEEQFGDTGPVMLDERLCESWLRQTAMREGEIDHALSLLYDDAGNELPISPALAQEIMDKHFPQNFNECLPTWGIKCDWHDCCHVKVVGDNPLRNGIFVLRTPHHTTDPVWEVIDVE